MSRGWVGGIINHRIDKRWFSDTIVLRGEHVMTDQKNPSKSKLTPTDWWRDRLPISYPKIVFPVPRGDMDNELFFAGSCVRNPDKDQPLEIPGVNWV